MTDEPYTGAAEVRSLNFTYLLGSGVLHTKMWIIDNRHFWVGRYVTLTLLAFSKLRTFDRKALIFCDVFKIKFFVSRKLCRSMRSL